MKKFPNIESVEIQDRENPIKEQAEPYSREEYIMVRKRIDEMISKLHIPEEGTENGEKKISY